MPQLEVIVKNTFLETVPAYSSSPRRSASSPPATAGATVSLFMCLADTVNEGACCSSASEPELFDIQGDFDLEPELFDIHGDLDLEFLEPKLSIGITRVTSAFMRLLAALEAVTALDPSGLETGIVQDNPSIETMIVQNPYGDDKSRVPDFDTVLVQDPSQLDSVTVQDAFGIDKLIVPNPSGLAVHDLDPYTRYLCQWQAHHYQMLMLKHWDLGHALLDVGLDWLGCLASTDQDLWELDIGD